MIPTLFTARCILRLPNRHDRDGLVALATDPEVRRFLGGSREVMVAQAGADALIAGQASVCAWAVGLRDRQEEGCIGLVTLAPHHDEDALELSYEFRPMYWGLGLAFESVKMVLCHAFDTMALPRIVSETQQANRASRRLLEKLGMQMTRTIERFGAQQIIYEIANSSVNPDGHPCAQRTVAKAD